jgi:hypothetical protein
MYALLQSYMAERGNRFEKLNGRLDPSVFVLTKWDMRFLRSEQEPLLVNGTEINQIALSPVFLNPSRDYLEAVISGRYPRAWAEYCVPRRLRGEDQLTAYSAGVLAGEPLQKLKVPDELRGQLEYGLEYKSAKELVDKLYKNIKGYTLTDGPTAPPPSGFKRLLREMFG